MKISFDRETMPDELYNVLLQHFVNAAVAQGLTPNNSWRFDNWVIECEVIPPTH